MHHHRPSGVSNDSEKQTRFIIIYKPLASKEGGSCKQKDFAESLGLKYLGQG